MWEKKIQSDPVIDVHPQITWATFDVIGRSGFGYEFNALSGQAKEYFKASQDLTEVVLLNAITNKTIWKLFFKKQEERLFKGQ